MDEDQGSHVVTEPRSRGDRQREAIVAAVRELLQEKEFADLSVSTISDRAGVARSGFYFYFDSKYAVLAQILAEATAELQRLTESFAPRGADESPAEFARRMVASAALAFAHNDPVVTACRRARETDAEIREILDGQIDVLVGQIVALVRAEVQDGTARPISDDLEALIRVLSATSSFMLSGDPTFIGPERNRDGALAVLERLWLYSLWGGGAEPLPSVSPTPLPPVSSTG